MHLYRAVKRAYLENYEGMGNSYRRGARWNLPNHPVLYFASSPSVAALELANYFPTPNLVPGGYVMGVYEVSDLVMSRILLLENMPADWNNFPHPESTKKIGSAWLEKKEELCLFVPSAATPGNMENIVIVNPKYPQIKQIKLTHTIPRIYSQRIFSGLEN